LNAYLEPVLNEHIGDILAYGWTQLPVLVVEGYELLLQCDKAQQELDAQVVERLIRNNLDLQSLELESLFNTALLQELYIHAVQLVLESFDHELLVLLDLVFVNRSDLDLFIYLIKSSILLMDATLTLRYRVTSLERYLIFLHFIE
jgi:hypothetical protein